MHPINSMATNHLQETIKGKRFLQHLNVLVVEEVFEKSKSSDEKVVEFKHPEDLEHIFDLTLNDATSDAELLQICENVIRYSVKTGHSRFFNQLFGGLDAYGLGGAILTEAINTSMFTYEVAPVFTVMEKALFKKMLALVGFDDGDAIFCPGGSISNMYGMNVARFKRHPDVKTKGMRGLPSLCMLASEKAHFSLMKGASFLGIGTENICTVLSDEKGRLIPKELENRILELRQQEREPFFVNATSGTTVLGAYDPLDEIADVCQKYGLWLHVDAAWGGGALLSNKYRGLMKGSERADSMTWNPHKMMGAPVQCSVFLTRHKNVLPECHSADAHYLFQQDKFYDVSYDTGDKSIQCGRKVDVLKLWLMWKAKGDDQFEKDIDNLFNCSRYLANLVKEKEGFRLVLEPQCTNVCFWYIPPSLRDQNEDEEWFQRLGKIAPIIKERMVKRGSMLIGYQPDGDYVNFFRMIISNLDTTVEDMDFVVNEIDLLGKDL